MEWWWDLVLWSWQGPMLVQLINTSISLLKWWTNTFEQHYLYLWSLLFHYQLGTQHRYWHNSCRILLRTLYSPKTWGRAPRIRRRCCTCNCCVLHWRCCTLRTFSGMTIEDGDTDTVLLIEVPEFAFNSCVHLRCIQCHPVALKINLESSIKWTWQLPDIRAASEHWPRSQRYPHIAPAHRIECIRNLLRLF